MELTKIVIFSLFQIYLIVLAQNVTSTESQRSKISSREIDDTAESSNKILKVKENETTILNSDKTTDSQTNVTIATTTPLIPIATVEAQIEKLDVTTKKSRVQIVAAQ